MSKTRGDADVAAIVMNVMDGLRGTQDMIVVGESAVDGPRLP